MPLPVEPPLTPMLARLEDALPEGDGWRYEPKWDGFRALVFKEPGRIEIISRNGQPLTRYFPELVETLEEALPRRCVVDGEIVLFGERGLDFDALLQRVHPAESRIQKLAQETPTSFVAFDLLAEGSQDLQMRPLDERRARLERSVRTSDSFLLCPQTASPEVARIWFQRFEGAGLDGVVAKEGRLRYVPGERVMVKVKHARTCDCVVGGYRKAKSGQGIGSLLLGLYDDEGRLVHAGATVSFTAKLRKELEAKLRPLEGTSSFHPGFSPGGPSRWNRGADKSWVPVRPELVCEVAFDHLQGHRFRHATRFLRWRPDKAPEECTYDQLEAPTPLSAREVIRLGAEGDSLGQ